MIELVSTDFWPLFCESNVCRKKSNEGEEEDDDDYNYDYDGDSDVHSDAIREEK